MGFADEVERFCKKADARKHIVLRKILFDLSTALVMKSPVGDPDYWIWPAPPGYTGGRFRGNWQYGLNAPNITTTQTIDKDGSSTIDGIFTKVDDKPFGNVHYVTNSLPYAKRLEDGWSRQAPHGMVRLTVNEFIPIVREAARALSNDGG